MNKQKKTEDSSDLKKAAKNYFSHFATCVFVLAFTVLLTFNGIGWYSESFTQIKEKIESRFAIFPHVKIEDGFKRVFYTYMWLTNRKVINTVVVMKDGRLTTARNDSPTFFDEKLNTIATLNDYLKEKNTPLLFVRVPDKMQDASLLPFGYTNSIIEDGARFVSMLKDRGVDTLDLREQMMKENMDFSTAFFRGDHHWTAETALWACGKIGSRLNTDYGFQLDESLWRPEAFHAIVYEKAFMGSEAGKIGDSRFNEDITALIPSFYTEFEVKEVSIDEDMEVIVSGNFADVFVPKSKDSQNSSFFYADLNAVDKGFMQYRNLAANKHKKILLIADSFGRALSPYLACTMEQVDYLYLSAPNNRKLYPVLEREDYDMVVFLIFDQILVVENEIFGEDRMNLGEPPR